MIDDPIKILIAGSQATHDGGFGIILELEIIPNLIL
jgi:hypothetical protein